jgi:hypothetical protein
VGDQSILGISDMLFDGRTKNSAALLAGPA